MATIKSLPSEVTTRSTVEPLNEMRQNAFTQKNAPTHSPSRTQTDGLLGELGYQQIAHKIAQMIKHNQEGQSSFAVPSGLIPEQAVKATESEPLTEPSVSTSIDDLLDFDQLIWVQSPVKRTSEEKVETLTENRVLIPYMTDEFMPSTAPVVFGSPVFLTDDTLFMATEGQRALYLDEAEMSQVEHSTDELFDDEMPLIHFEAIPEITQNTAPVLPIVSHHVNTHERPSVGARVRSEIATIWGQDEMPLPLGKAVKSVDSSAIKSAVNAVLTPMETQAFVATANSTSMQATTQTTTQATKPANHTPSAEGIGSGEFNAQDVSDVKPAHVLSMEHAALPKASGSQKSKPQTPELQTSEPKTPEPKASEPAISLAPKETAPLSTNTSTASAASNMTTPELQSALLQETMTKSEKKLSVLQKNEQGDNATITHSTQAPLNTETMPRQAVTEPAASSAQSTLALAKQAMAMEGAKEQGMQARTLTYTFNQWQQAPSVTFELATKNEFIASTYSREVQQSLQDNRHLLGSEKSVYIRQHEERGQQHHQRQQQQQSEEE